MRRLPTEIDVIGFPLTVEQTTQAAITRRMGRTPNDSFYYGYLEPHRKIVIRKDLPLAVKWEVLIHEIGHEVEFIITDDLHLGTCDISMEPIHSLYHRLLSGVLLSNGLI